MTDNNENNEEKPRKKLSLRSSKLSLKRGKEGQSASKEHSTSSRSPGSKRLTVEVKNSASQTSEAASGTSDHEATEQSGTPRGLTKEEMNQRLNVLKKASKRNQPAENEGDTRFSSNRDDTAHSDDSASGESELEKDKSGENLTTSSAGYDYISSSLSKDSSSKQSDYSSEDRDSTKEGRTKLGTKKSKTKDSKYEDEDIILKGSKAKQAEAEAGAKAKKEESKKSKKVNIHNIEEEEEDKGRSLASIKRARDKEKRKQASESTSREKVYREVTIPETITVNELSSRMTERSTDVIKELMKLGIMCNANQNIDAETAELIVTTFGHTPNRVQESDIENVLIREEEDKEEDLQPRPPVVTIMGHVDHGKTSLLDALKSTDIVAREAGGITQHIGAYKVRLDSGDNIVFLDTPGHEAFTAMRSRGAETTDIVVLVVAADDGIKDQTVEAINHAKAAEVPIIVAVNKIDKPDTDINKVKNELLNYNLVSEDLGGDIMVIGVSAAKGSGLDKLEEAILLNTELLELKANPNAEASGVVIESKIDKKKGPLATLLVQRGTLRKGDIVVSGQGFGRIRRMIDAGGNDLEEASPSTPVEVLGLNTTPDAGDSFNVLDDERKAKEIAEFRERKAKEKRTISTEKTSLEDLFSKASGEVKVKNLPLIIKGDVQGSVEAIASSLEKIKHEEVKINILHKAAGGINESDVSLAKASGAIILGFNVRAPAYVQKLAGQDGIEIRYYNVIYNLIDDIKSAMSGMLDPIYKEQFLGNVEIRKVFSISKIGKIAGSYVTKGIVKKGAGVRLLRDNVVIHEGKLKTLKRFQDDVKEVKEGYECGIAFENYNDIKEGDIVEVYQTVEEQKQID
jgi:translation initiation factor IF-2